MSEETTTEYWIPAGTPHVIDVALSEGSNIRYTPDGVDMDGPTIYALRTLMNTHQVGTPDI